MNRIDTIAVQDSANNTLPVSIADIRAAHARIRDAIQRTPTVISETLSKLTGATVYLKFENHQFTAAYKERGALNRLLLLDAEARAKGVVAASAGNHAQGLAYHGKRLGVPVTIVMPQTTPTVKVMQTEGHGATVILHGEKFEEALAYARELETARGLTFVHAFDEPDVIAGQGTVALEMLEDAPDIDTLVIPIGGGGLFSGMATAARALKPDIQLIGVQAELYPSMYDYVKQANLPCDGDTLAEGIAVKEPGLLTRRFVAEMANDVVLVTERALEQAVSLLLQIEKTVVEGAGAVGLAALMKHRARFAGRKVGLILSGGNIEPLVLGEIIQRGMVKSGRLARLRMDVRDVPGALADVATLLGKLGANIDEVQHQRAFSSLSVERAEIEVVVHTRGVAHIEEILAAMRAQGYRAERIG
jgi:threonine dehydratase